MEVSDYLASVSDVFGRDFGRLVVSGPFNGVLQTGASASASANLTRVQDIFDFEFFDAINLH